MTTFCYYLSSGGYFLCRICAAGKLYRDAQLPTLGFSHLTRVPLNPVWWDSVHHGNCKCYRSRPLPSLPLFFFLSESSCQTFTSMPWAGGLERSSMLLPTEETTLVVLACLPCHTSSYGFKHVPLGNGWGRGECRHGKNLTYHAWPESSQKQ